MTKLGRRSETTFSQTEIEDKASQSLHGQKKQVDTKLYYKNISSSIDSRTFGTRTEKGTIQFSRKPNSETTGHNCRGTDSVT